MENIILGMHPQHRRQIDRYCDEISPDIDMVKLWPVLVSSKVFNWDDVNASEWEVRICQFNTRKNNCIIQSAMINLYCKLF